MSDILGHENNAHDPSEPLELSWPLSAVSSVSGFNPNPIDPALQWWMCLDESTAYLCDHEVSASTDLDCLPLDVSPVSSPGDWIIDRVWEPGSPGTAGRAANVYRSNLLQYAETPSAGVHSRPPLDVRWRCDKCQRNFLTSKERELHAIKALCRSYVCHHCGKDFSRRDTMWRHMRKHRDRAHACSQCDMTFTRKDNLTRHTQQRHAHPGFS